MLAKTLSQASHTPLVARAQLRQPAASARCVHTPRALPSGEHADQSAREWSLLLTRRLQSPRLTSPSTLLPLVAATPPRHEAHQEQLQELKLRAAKGLAALGAAAVLSLTPAPASAQEALTFPLARVRAVGQGGQAVEAWGLNEKAAFRSAEPPVHVRASARLLLRPCSLPLQACCTCKPVLARHRPLPHAACKDSPIPSPHALSHLPTARAHHDAGCGDLPGAADHGGGVDDRDAGVRGRHLQQHQLGPGAGGRAGGGGRVEERRRGAGAHPAAAGEAGGPIHALDARQVSASRAALAGCTAGPAGAVGRCSRPESSRSLQHGAAVVKSDALSAKSSGGAKAQPLVAPPRVPRVPPAGSTRIFASATTAACRAWA